MIDPLHTACRRCGGPVPRVRGPARVYCGQTCRRLVENELRALRHQLDAAYEQAGWYSELAAHPLPGMATSEHSRKEVARWRARVVEIEREIELLQQPPQAAMLDVPSPGRSGVSASAKPLA